MIELMARPIASGNISFGLVSIPVKLFATTDHSSSISFNMLDSSDDSRVKQQYINPNTGDVVERKNMVKGYEFAKGQFVTFTNEEIKDLMERASPSIAITEFVPLVEVDPIYFSSTYYLGPETGGERAYHLLGEAMKHTGRCAVAKYAARGKQYLVVIRPFEEGLMMQQLHYHDEIRSFSEVPVGEQGEVQHAELELAMQLIEQIANDEFEPEKYEDEVRQRILDAIQRKVDGAEVTAAIDDAPKAEIIDLMEALKASLGASGKGGKSGRKPAKKASGKSAGRVDESEDTKKNSGKDSGKKSKAKKAASG